ncbi:PQQ-dependent sugar dehydrogenase [Paracoccus sp. CPCC 101403]|uniref:PQQ-dependent sugar dehydrogenase n=1 Tax=Paracoccus broussonetiae TaxID=3075834 RepID=A0ABU3EJ61_9RHOB|nr:PQQ-dependent sugar dehydrogenase [Paracoccus sp. CPCC 101403]MDT1064293.1 PQQ-dependent sugar dehydrogenase [Paracoccus sp. CPCC 101403]
MSPRRNTFLGLTLIALTATMAQAAPVHVGEVPYVEAPMPFTITAVATLDTPWAIAMMPDGRMLITEKPGRMFIVTPEGKKTSLDNVPKVEFVGQNGLLDVALAPDFASSNEFYITYLQPGDQRGMLVLAKARLVEDATGARLEDFRKIWTQTPPNGGEQPGGVIAFDPDGQHLFLALGDRMTAESAQNPDEARGKILRLNLDGTTPEDNPQFASGGVRAQTWTTGHRNPYGLAFDANGKLWSIEMGPFGGDEVNLIEPGKNYGWPEVSEGDNYDGTPIPRHATRPEFTPPLLYWSPIIAPTGMAFYQGDMFPEWKGSAFVGGLASELLVRLAFDDKGGVTEGNRWSIGGRVRDVAVAADGAIWAIEDTSEGRLWRLSR